MYKYVACANSPWIKKIKTKNKNKNKVKQRYKKMKENKKINKM